MVNSIKTENNVKLINIEITNITNELINAYITLKINNHNVKLNDFTQGILKETIYATINSLKIDDEINKIEIIIEEV